MPSVGHRVILASMALLAIVAMPALAADPPADTSLAGDTGVSTGPRRRRQAARCRAPTDPAKPRRQPFIIFTPGARDQFRRVRTHRSTRCCCRLRAWRRIGSARSISRGDHANVQYRINGVELPEGLSVFGQALETRFASSMSLITGALPAQYRLADCRRGRYPDQDRHQRSGFRIVDVWRQLGLRCNQASSMVATPVQWERISFQRSSIFRRRRWHS